MLSMAFALPVIAVAADYPWLTFKMTDDSEISVLAADLAINSQNGYLILSSAFVDKTIPLDQIYSMRFTTTSAGVETIEDIQSAVGDYYNLSGIMIGSFSSSDAARNVLPPGIYIVKNNSGSHKITL